MAEILTVYNSGGPERVTSVPGKIFFLFPAPSGGSIVVLADNNSQNYRLFIEF